MLVAVMTVLFNHSRARASGPSVRLTIFLFVAWLSMGIADATAQRRVPTDQTEIKLSFAPLVKRVSPAVVNIFTRKIVTRRRVSPLFDDPFFRRFFGDSFGGGERQREEGSLGSGVLVGPDGLVVTNHHVIEGASEIKVVLSDRREFQAQVVGTDERTDLAMLRIDPGRERLPFLQFRDSDTLEVGDLVLAIGNPFGFRQTVTSGIVSALARTQAGISDLGFFIQTDAAINPGNSGGALVTMDGKLVGINTVIFSQTGNSIGIGFAVPSNMVQSVIRGLSSGGKLVRPWLGAQGQQVTADLASSLGLSRPQGVVVSNVYPRGPADRAGLKPGDVILAIGGREVNDPRGLQFRIATQAIGDRVDLRVWRRNRMRTIRFPVEAPPRKPRPAITELGGAHPLSGATVANLSPALADELGFDLLKSGVIVTEVRRGSAAHRLQFEPGDIMRSVNRNKIESVDGLKLVMSRPVDRWRMSLERDGKTLSFVINR